jgi:hypothetical protein
MVMDDDFIESEEKESDVYGDNAREDLAENDEISPEEEAFMEGYDKSDDMDDELANDKYEKAFDEEEPAAEEEEEDDFEDEF